MPEKRKPTATPAATRGSSIGENMAQKLEVPPRLKALGVETTKFKITESVNKNADGQALFAVELEPGVLTEFGSKAEFDALTGVAPEKGGE